MLKPTIKASELIDRLKMLVEEHGDLPVYADDADTGWRLPAGIVHRKEKTEEGWPERLEIKTDYYGEPEGGV